MEQLLRQLLNRLDDIGSENEELFDSECRERLSSAIMEGFVRARGVDVLDEDFGDFSPEGNRLVREDLIGLACFDDLRHCSPSIWLSNNEPYVSSSDLRPLERRGTSSIPRSRTALASAVRPTAIRAVA